MTATTDPQYSTCSALDMVVADMGPTLTYRKRIAYWVPATERQHLADHRDGTLRIVMQQGSRWNCNQIAETYAVERVDQQGGNGMGFYVAKLTGERAGEVYLTLPKHAVPDAMIGCECKATRCKLEHCCHRDALAALIELGAI